MLQATAQRFVHDGASRLVFHAPMSICAHDHKDTLVSQLAAIGAKPSKIALEPLARNTAAAAFIAALMVQDEAPDDLVLLLPADHVIADVEAFRAAIERAAETARTRIVTFGIDPTAPETGYGYIQRGEPLAEGVFSVVRFAEKPDRDTAAAYIAQGDYAWNAGIFLFAPSVMIAEMERFEPKIAQCARAAFEKADRVGEVLDLDAESFAACPSKPVDIAVMERTDLAAVAPCSIGWADVGSWSELWRLSEQDADGNVIRGQTALVNTRNSLVWGNGPPVAVVGLENIIVVSTPDGVVVMPMDKAQDIRAAVEALKAVRQAT
jgi:mannose-1-phosphate guanylyltransferase/mannose-6-phosphate isomerase